MCRLTCDSTTTPSLDRWRSVSMACAPTSTAALNAHIVFSGYQALYPRCAIAWGSCVDRPSWLAVPSTARAPAKGTNCPKITLVYTYPRRKSPPILPAASLWSQNPAILPTAGMPRGSWVNLGGGTEGVRTRRRAHAKHTLRENSLLPVPANQRRPLVQSQSHVRLFLLFSLLLLSLLRSPKSSVASNSLGSGGDCGRVLEYQ